jgi:hypothetical protein
MRIRRKEPLIFAAPVALALIAAYVEWAVAGMPAVPPADSPSMAAAHSSPRIATAPAGHANQLTATMSPAR